VILGEYDKAQSPAAVPGQIDHDLIRDRWMALQVGVVKLYPHLHWLGATIKELLPGSLVSIDGIQSLVGSSLNNHINTRPPDVHRITNEGITIQILYVARYARPATAILRRR
jgi:hypothetical protein